MNSTTNAGCLRLSVLGLLVMLSACAMTESPNTMATGDDVPAPQYDMNSWKSSIDSECRSYFDGCNNCVREPGKMGACTRKACAVYQQPRCLDDAAAAAQTAESNAAKRVDYVCDAGYRFSVSFHEYVQDDQRVRLDQDEVMFSDRQTGTVSRLQRERSASGTKYIDASGLLFFAKGNDALVLRQGERLYSNCLRQP